MLIIDETKKCVKLEGPLGHTVLNIQKHDISGCFCISLDLKESKELKVTDITETKNQSNTLIQKKKPNDTNIPLKLFLEKTVGNLKITNRKAKVKKSIISSLYEQKLQGVSRGYFTYLRLFGVGYRVFLVKDTLTFKLGFSHFVKIKIPASIRVFLPEPTLICFYGLDKNQVTQIAAKVQQIKPPSPYKGKGIRVLDAQIKLKIGKKKS